MNAGDSTGASGPPGQQFPPTRWSVVLAARETGEAGQVAALDELCRAYWFPLYVYVRRRGYSPEDAEDLTQSYFAALIERDYLAQADRGRGKLRSFLLTTLKHFLADEWSKSSALKRGGGRQVVSIERAAAEERYALEGADTESPDRLFEKRWALTVLDNVLEALRSDYARSGQGKVFERLREFLAWNSAEAYREAAAELDIKEASVRVAVFRMRRRYGDLLRAHIADTVASPEDVTAEMNHLFELLRA